MGRYRTPSAPKSNYLTPEGADKLRGEITQLWKIERPQVTAAVSAAAKNGDRSENGDYIYGKKRLREIDSRVRYLSKRLEYAKVISDKPSDTNKVFFAAWVRLMDEEDNEHNYRIVGPDEIGHNEAYISMDSPVAKALFGKATEDSVVVQTPNGEMEYFIAAVRY